MVALFGIAASLLLALPSVLATPQTSPNALYARQAGGFNPSSIPATCLENKCQSLVNSLSTCTDLKCMCTNAIVTSMKSCIQCAVDANIDGYNQTVADASLKTFTDGCKTAGFTVAGGSGTTGGAMASMSVGIVGAIFAAALGVITL
ncbi:hypothetical protein B0H34DRAFT_802187 [Crassisporium funariophilum]|nr:hypothetical protein B0H34DRAFT_802187 [Crassisporium funariophilum]